MSPQDVPRLRKNLWAGTLEGLLATPWIFLMVPGNFVMAALLTQYFGITKALCGIIVALPALSNAVQIVLVPWLTRFLKPKDLAVGLGWFNLGLWVMLTASLGWSFWGRLSDRLGSIPLLAVGLLLWEASNLARIFVTPHTAWVLYPLWIWGGFVSVSYWMCNFNRLLNLLPANARLLDSSLHLALISVAATAAPALSGALLEHYLAGSPDGTWVYRAGFAIKSGAILLSILVVGTLYEPHRPGTSAAPGAFFTLRMILSNFGPAFLSTLTPQRVRPSPRKRPQ